MTNNGRRVVIFIKTKIQQFVPKQFAPVVLTCKHQQKGCNYEKQNEYFELLEGKVITFYYMTECELLKTFEDIHCILVYAVKNNCDLMV